jgi:ATP-dependent RNA helicase DHR2
MPEHPLGSGAVKDLRLHDRVSSNKSAIKGSLFPPEAPEGVTSTGPRRGKKRKRDHGRSGARTGGPAGDAPSLATDAGGEKGAGRNSDVSLSESFPRQPSASDVDMPTHVGHSRLHQRGQLLNKARSLLHIRKTLPIWSHQAEIRRHLREKDVLLLIGETGSGKSTQVPQFLVNEPWCQRRKVRIKNKEGSWDVSVGGCIAITEPRRVAAISLARRVAAEMGTPLGSASPASQVGYSVRFDNSTSPSTRIKFLTEGMLLQEMLRDPWLRHYSAIIVDEVHERGINVDLVTGFVRNMVTGDKQGRGGVPLKVVVMSATADMNRLKGFYEEGFLLRATENQRDTSESGSIREGTDKHLDEGGYESSWSGISPGNGDALSSGESCKTPNNSAQSGQPTGHVAACFIEGRHHPVTAIYTPEPVQDFVDAALRTILQIHYSEPMPGDILVFLTGQDDIEALENLIEGCAAGMGPEVPKVGL